jgi:hypothetical protein
MINYNSERVSFESLVGMIFTDISVNKTSDEIDFTASNGSTYKMCHDQDCCESVSIEEIIGDIDDLINTPILTASERTDDLNEGVLTDGDRDGANLWTFYELRTIKGSVTIRWYGSSNGYYSVGVDLYKV